MWSPTHVQVTVLRAIGLLTKGKADSNDCFVTIALGKTKYQTSVKEKASANVEWHEECELPIPDQGNTAEIILTVLHRNFLGVDEFLGRVCIPLNTLDVYERPKSRSYSLQSKQGQESKNKNRGKLDVIIAFNVKSGSLVDLSKKEKHKSSIGQLSHLVGGSLLSIGSAEKRKGIKKFAKSIGSKINLKGKKKDSDEDSTIGSINSLKTVNEPRRRSKQTAEDADPGVVSEDEDEFTFDDLSHKSSGSSLNQPTPSLSPNINKNDTNKLDVIDNDTTENLRRYTLGALPPTKPPRVEVKIDEWDLKLYGKQSKNVLKSSADSLNRRSWESPKLSSRIEEEVTDPQETEIEEVHNLSKSQETTVKVEKESMFSKLKNFRRDKSENDIKTAVINNNQIERVIVGGENENTVPVSNNRISNELLGKFDGKSREELILMICDLQRDFEHNKRKLKDLEDYLDELLLRVMETTPRILQNPYKYGLNNKLKG